MSLNSKKIGPAKRVFGNFEVPGDKSISHRAIILAALARGESNLDNVSHSLDVISTMHCFEKMGVRFERHGTKLRVYGVGKLGLKKPCCDLDCGNSGTTMRLLMGVLAGQKFSSRLIGDKSLSRRPMDRVAKPLQKMGACIELDDNGCAPVKLRGCSLRGAQHTLLQASAQVKSAIILAALQASGETVLNGRIQSRDHTERLLRHFGADIKITSETISLSGEQKLKAADLYVPGDISSAAYFMAATSMLPESDIHISNLSLNPSRMGIINVLKRMGANIEHKIVKEKPEPFGHLHIRYSRLRGAEICGDEIPDLIDELPLLAVIAATADGKTVVCGAGELRVKESDRLNAVKSNMEKMGVKIEVYDDGFKISGPQKFRSTVIDSFEDHRIAMSFSIAALMTNGTTEILNSDCVSISYPNFYRDLKGLVYE